MSYRYRLPLYLRTSVDKMPNTHGCDVPFGVFAIACKAETLIDASDWTLLIDTRARPSLHEHPRPRAHSPELLFSRSGNSSNRKMTHSLYGHFITKVLYISYYSISVHHSLAFVPARIGLIPHFLRKHLPSAAVVDDPVPGWSCARVTAPVYPCYPHPHRNWVFALLCFVQKSSAWVKSSL